VTNFYILFQELF